MNRAVGEEAGNASCNILELAIVSACVHDCRSTNRTWDSAGKLVTCKSRFECRLRNCFIGGSCLYSNNGLIDGNVSHALADFDNHTRQTRIGNEQIASAAYDPPGGICLFGGVDGCGDVRSTACSYKELSGTAAAERGVFAHGLIY